MDSYQKEAIKQEKLLAMNVLIKLMVIDPNAKIAGGAPRDWANGETCNDIDIFLETTARQSWEIEHQIKKALQVTYKEQFTDDRAQVQSEQSRADMLGFRDVTKIPYVGIQGISVAQKIVDITHSEQYDNSNIKGIYECVIALLPLDQEENPELYKTVQIIVCEDASFEKLFSIFDCSINCIGMRFTEYAHRDFDPIFPNFWVTHRSTLNEATDETGIIVFTEESWAKGIEDNKAYKRFVKAKDSAYRVGNEREMIVKILNIHKIRPTMITTNVPEIREPLSFDSDMPF